MSSDARPKAPGFFVEPGGDANAALDPSRQDDGLERIHQNDEDQNNAGDRYPPMHKLWDSDDAEMAADSEMKAQGVTRATSSAIFTACNSFSKARRLRVSRALAPSLFASLGLSWTSMKMPSTPAATAARESTGINSGWPPLTTGRPSSLCDADG